MVPFRNNRILNIFGKAAYEGMLAGVKMQAKE